MGTYWSSEAIQKPEIKVAQPWFDQIMSKDLHYYVVIGDIPLIVGQDVILHCNLEKVSMKVVGVTKHSNVDDAIRQYTENLLWPGLSRHKKALDRTYGGRNVTVIQF